MIDGDILTDIYWCLYVEIISYYLCCQLLPYIHHLTPPSTGARGNISTQNYNKESFLIFCNQMKNCDCGNDHTHTNDNIISVSPPSFSQLFCHTEVSAGGRRRQVRPERGRQTSGRGWRRWRRLSETESVRRTWRPGLVTWIGMMRTI